MRRAPVVMGYPLPPTTRNSHKTQISFVHSIHSSCLIILKFRTERGNITDIRSICLAHWGRVTHICVGNLTIIGSDNSLSPGRRQAITWTNVGILLIEPLGTNFSEMLIEIHTFSFKKIHFVWKIASILSRHQCVSLHTNITVISSVGFQGPLLLTWFNFYPNMDK